MFLKRLSIALCALMCFGTLLFGASPESSDNANPVEEENIWMAPEAVPDFYLTYTAPKCFGDSDGSIIVNITTGTGPFKVEYRPSSTSSFIIAENSISGPTIPIKALSADIYDVRVTDLNLATNNSDIEEDFEVKEFSLLTLGAQIDPINCSSETGKITLNASGGDGSYNYTLSLSDSTISPDGLGGNVFSGLAEGSYIAKVIDGNGCPETKSSGLNINIPEPISPIVTEGTIDCPGGTTTIELTNLPSDASSYQIKLDGNTPQYLDIDGSTAIISNVSAGSYALTVERTGCTSGSDDWPSSGSHIVDIDDYEPVGFDWGATNPITDNISIDCYDDETTLTVTLTGGKAGETVELYLKDRETSNEIPLNPSLQINDPIDFNVKKGEYSLIARIPSCSYEKSQDFNIGGPSVPFEITSIEKTDISCPGGTGALKINYSVVTGQVQYSYNENPFQDLPSNNTITGLGEGPYSVVLRHSGVCESDPVIESLEEPSEITVSLDVTQPLSCPGGDNGILTATTSGGGDGGYRYTLYDNDGDVVPDYDDIPGSATRQFTGLTAGIYEVDVHTEGCSDNKTAQAEILSIEEVTIEFDYDPVLCNNELVEEFHVTASGGDGSLFTYTLKETDGTPHSESPLTETVSGAGVIFHDLEPGNTYHIEASYGSCDPVIEDNITIQNPSPLNVNYQPLIELDCYGGNTDIVIKASGEPPFEISEGDDSNFVPFNSITGNQYKHTLTGKTRGTYTYYIKDANGCVYNDGRAISINVTQPDEISVNVANTPQVKCYGEADAVVELEITGGRPPFWVGIASGRPPQSTDSNGLVTFMLPAGEDYDVVIEEDGNRCSVTRTDVFSVDGPPAPLSFTTMIDKPMLDCYGDSTLVTVVDISGGWPSTYEVHVKGGNGIDEDLPSSNSIYLKHGTYYLSVNDINNGCIARDTIEISQPPKLKLEDFNYTDITCNGSNDATITFTASGGTSPYSWGINDIPTNIMSSDNESITNADYNFEAGNTYSLYVGDDKGCTVESEEIEITEPDPITFAFTYDTVSCNGASDAMVTITEATGGKDVKYRSFITDETATETEGSFPDISGLAAGDYSLLITDGSGICSSPSQTLTIVEPAPVEFHTENFIVTDIECFKEPATGIIEVDATGGFPNAYELEYKLTGENIETGYQDSPEFDELKAGTYNVTARLKNGRIPDSKRCEVTSEDITIAPAKEIVIASIEVLDVTCHNDPGAIQINASGGSDNLEYYIDNDASFTPNDGGFFADVMDPDQPSTTLQVVVSDKQHVCKVSEEITITNPEELEIAFIDKEDPTCSNIDDGKIYLEVTGGTVSAPEDYSFVDANNTAVEYEYVIEGVNGYYVLTGLAGDKTYTPKVIDGTGICSAIVDAPVEIVKPAPVMIADIDWGEKLCYGSNDDETTIHVTGGTGGYYYSMNNGTTMSKLNDSIFVDLEVGEKYPYVEDENGCPNLNEVESHLFEQPPKFEVYYEFFDIQCYDDEYGDMELKILGGTNSYDVTYNDADFSETNRIINIPKSSEDTTQFKFLENDINLEPNVTYNFFIKDENGCHAQNIDGVRKTSDVFADTIFTIPEPLVLTELRQKPVDCSNENTGIIEFDATGGTTRPGDGYVMEVITDGRLPKYNAPGSEMVEKLFAGQYKCYLTDANGCEAVTDLTDEGFNYDTITVAYNNESIKLSISDIYQPTCDRTYDGYIEVNVEDYLFDGVTAEVEVYDANVDRYFPLENDEADTIVADSDYSNDNPVNTLYFANGVRVADYITIGDYRITVTDNYTGCDAKVDTLITSIDGDNCPEMNRYNYFTPDNGDDYNDEWIIFGSQNQKYTLQIYTSYGELVFDDEDISDNEGIKWDGTDEHGRPMPSGTYIYLLRKNEGTPKDTLINGNISIIRSGGK